MSNSRLTRDEFILFNKLLKQIDFFDLIHLNFSYSFDEDNFNNNSDFVVEVKFFYDDKKYKFDDGLLYTFPKYFITIKSEENFFELEVKYKATFELNEEEEVKDILNNEKVNDFFFNYQVSKFIWGFLREDLNRATSKIGIKPLVLKKLR